MIKNFAIVINTHTSSKDVWPMFFGQLEKFFPKQKTYVFVNDGEGLPGYCNVVLYDNSDKFRTQYLKCIKQVEEKFILYLNEDYVLYNHANLEIIENYVSIMDADDILAFNRVGKGYNNTENLYKEHKNLYYLSPGMDHFFSQSATIWRRSVIEKIHELGPDTHIGIEGMVYGHFEVDANKVCKELNLTGLYSFYNENKRGMFHWDSNVFPYIATAIIKGKWNISEYNHELMPLINEYNIDITKRGTY